jgi:hypothetical protein
MRDSCGSTARICCQLHSLMCYRKHVFKRPPSLILTALLSQCPSTSIYHKPWRISFRYQQVQACTSRFPDSAEGVLGRQRRTVFGGEGGRAAAESSGRARRGNAYSRHAQAISAGGQRRRYLTDLCSCIDLLYFFLMCLVSFFRANSLVPPIIAVTPTYTAIDDTLSLSLYVQLRVLCGRCESNVERSTKAA